MENNNSQNDGQSPYSSNPQPSTQQATEQLGSGRKKTIIIAIFLVLFTGIMVNSIFGSSDKKESNVNLNAGQNGKEQHIVRGEDETPPDLAVPLPPTKTATLQPPPPSIDTSLLPPPDLPPISDVPEPTISDIPPPPPPISDNSGLFKGGKNDKDLEARIRSNMLIIDGGKTENADASRTPYSNALVQSDPNRAFADNVIKGTGAEKEVATRLNNLSMTIAQGKIINAVLETAIDTQLPGTLRAIVSRDTYAEAGRTILIPKGSRLIGTYNTGILQGQNRVLIIWTRLIRPDGIDIAIGSAGVDGLGRAGIQGFVDNRYLQIFSGAILTTALSLGAAVASDKLLPDANTTTTSSGGGSTTTNASPAQQSAGNAVNNLTDISKNVISKIVDIRPTITIDQGTRISIFVNRDLTFPPDLNDVFFVQ